jgi:NAD(P)-dependent dehydrogenase (short-subunit alcohol dehydrogenase family)
MLTRLFSGVMSCYPVACIATFLARTPTQKKESAMPGALITGASQGIGRATALRFAREKIPVALVARGSSHLQATADELTQSGAAVFTFPTELTNPEEIYDACAKAEDALGGVEYLINNAGIAPKVPIDKMSLAIWNEVIQTNLTASFCFAQAIAPRMIERKSGRIIFVSSISATRPFGGFSAYAASKAGMIGMSRSLAEELKPHHVQSIVVAPGSVATALLTKANPGLQADMTPEEVADTIFFAATGPRAITGSTIDIFG